MDRVRVRESSPANAGPDLSPERAACRRRLETMSKAMFFRYDNVRCINPGNGGMELLAANDPPVSVFAGGKHAEYHHTCNTRAVSLPRERGPVFSLESQQRYRLRHTREFDRVINGETAGNGTGFSPFF